MIFLRIDIPIKNDIHNAPVPIGLVINYFNESFVYGVATTYY